MTETHPIRKERVQLKFTGKGRTKQSHKDECDINKLMARYANSGQLPATNPYPARYGDFSDVPDFQQAVNQVNEANSAFADLPSAIRTRFGNDPTQLLEFMANPANEAEAIELGIIPAKTVPTPLETPIVEASPPETGGDSTP